MTMIARHVTRTWNAQVARRNTLNTQETAQSGNLKTDPTGESCKAPVFCHGLYSLPASAPRLV